MTGQNPRTEPTIRPLWVRAILAIGLAGATLHSGGAALVSMPPH